MYNNSAVARLLIGGGADPNALDEQEHETPLLRAAMNGGVDVAKVLIANGAAVNMKSGSDGDTPLHAASMDNRTEMVGITYQDGRGYQCPKLQRQDTRAGNRRQAHKGTAWREEVI
jgi:hypothetical protein